MELRRLLIALMSAAAMSVILVGIALPAEVPTGPVSDPSPQPSLLTVWAESNYQGDLLGGVNHSIVIPVPVLPVNAGTVYVDGSFSMISWILFSHGVFNQSGTCGNSFAPVGACSVYFGIWTSSAWSRYLSGGPAAPTWCFPGDIPGCQNDSAGEVGTSNLAGLDGTGWDIVLWNVEPFQLSGSYAFTVYSSAASR